MLRQHMAACLFVTALAAPAFGQSNPPMQSGAGGDRPVATGSGSATGGSPSMRPGTATESGAAPLSTSSSSTAPAGGATTMTAPPPASTTTTASPPTSPSGSTMSTAEGSGTSGQFITQQQANQLMVSKLIGTAVVGQNNESIGDVNDVLMERSGRTIGVVIGVGGFLGIGEKDVAIPFEQLELTSAPESAAGTNTTGVPATTGTTGTATNTAATGSRAADVTRIMIKMSREQLQNAPRFAAYGSSESTSSTTGSTTSTPGTPAPRQ